MTNAEIFSLECFVNSLLREWDGTDVHSSELLFFDGRLRIGILENKGQSYYHLTGQVQLDGKALNVQETISNLTDLYLKSNRLGRDKKDIFLERISESLENMSSTLSKRGDQISAFYKSNTLHFIDGEQALYIGHNYHPYPKNRGGFTEEDFFKYSPELGQDFSLTWFLVSPEIVHVQNASNFKNQWQKEIFEIDLKDTSVKKEAQTLIDKGYIPMPFHPWQEQHITKLSFIKDYILNQKIYILPKNKEQNKWKATSSLRAIYNENSPYMLKCSLTLRLTNSIRHLQEAEVVRGMQVHDVFSTQKGKDFLNKFSDFHIIFEPAFMAFKDPNGKILKESIIICRENLFKDGKEKNAIVLATINQKAPNNDKTLAEILVLKSGRGKDVMIATKEWFSGYLKHALLPLLTAASNYGVYLGAHQQNLILSIDKEGMPNGAYFRDCQGTGYSSLGHKNFGKECPSLTIENGNILPNAFADTLFSYYLIINSTFSTITALSYNHVQVEKELYQDLRIFLKELRQSGVENSSCLDYLLDNHMLSQKGNFGCCLKDINENTVENPLAIYNQIKNPIFSDESLI